MFLLSCGGWYVGNTAVLEWLARFDEPCYLKGDFHELRKPNGIYDCIIDVNIQDKLKISKSLIIHHIKGIARSVLCLLGLSKRRGHGYELKYNMYLLVSLLKYHFKLQIVKTQSLNWEEEFWRKSFSKMGRFLDKSSTDLLLQNPIYYDEISPEHASIWRSIFIDKKLFFVTRDPIDQFIEIYNKGELEYGETKFRSGTEGLTPIETFFIICKRTYQSRLKMLEEYSPSELAVISFENFASMSPNLEKQMKVFFNITSIEKSKFDFDYTKSNISLKTKYPSVYNLIKSHQVEIDELYEYKDKLESTDHFLKT